MSDQIFVFGPFELDRDRQLLTRHGAAVHIGGRAMDLLIALATHGGNVVSTSALMAKAWPNMAVEESNLRMHITLLRKALADGESSTRYIINVPGRGYRLVTPPEGTKETTSHVPVTRRGFEAQNLPLRISRVFGREDDVIGLIRVLEDERFVTILGPGGIGKTTLALEIAKASATNYAQGVCYIDLSSARENTLVPSVVAAALGLPVTSTNPTPNLISFLHDKTMLMIFDTCEPVIGGAASLAEALLANAPGIRLLATSREPLRADGERRYRLSTLEAGPECSGIQAVEAQSYPAIALFIDRASAITSSFSLTDHNAQALSELCRRLDGLPLAIELAAARIDSFTIQEMLERLGDRFRLLNEGRRTAIPRQQTLQATFDWSYDLLTPFDQHVLRILGIFQEDFSIDAALAVLANMSVPEASVLSAIRSLELRSLVFSHTRGGRSVIRQLDSIRAYALEKLQDRAEIDQISDLYIHYLCTVFSTSEERLAVGQRRDWLDDHKYLLDDVRAMLRWASSASGDLTLYVQLAAAAAPLFWELALLDEQREISATALSVIAKDRRGNDANAMILHSAYAFSLFYTKGLHPDVYLSFSQASTIAETLNDTRFRLRALWGLFGAKKVAGDYHSALSFSQQYQIVVSENEVDRQSTMTGERMMAMALHFLGRHAESQSLLTGILHHATVDAGDARAPFQYDNRVTAAAQLSRDLWIQGFPDQAALMAEQSLGEAISINHPLSICYVLTFGACPVSIWRGDKDHAEQYVKLLLDYSLRSSLQYWLFWGRCYEAVLSDKIEISLVHPIPDINALAITPLHADMLATNGSAFVGDIAVTRTAAGLNGFAACEVLRFNAEQLAKRRESAGDQRVEVLFMQSLVLAREQGALSWELRTAISLARYWKAAGRFFEAHDLLSAVYGRFTEGFSTLDLLAAKDLLTLLKAEVI